MEKDLGIERTCDSLIDKHIFECGLHNEGPIASYTNKLTNDTFTVYNDGYQCCVLVNDIYVKGKDLEEMESC